MLNLIYDNNMNLEDMTVYYFVKSGKGLYIANKIAEEIPITILPFEKGCKTSIVLQRNPQQDYDLLVSLDYFGNRFDSELYDEGCELVADGEVLTKQMVETMAAIELGMLKRFILPYGSIEFEEDLQDMTLIAYYNSTKKKRTVLFDFWETLADVYYPFDMGSLDE